MNKKFSIFLTLIITFSLILFGCTTKNTDTKMTNQDIADKAFNESIDLTGINSSRISEEEQGNRIIMDSVALSQLASKLNIKLAGVPTSKLGKIPSEYENIIQIGLPMNPNLEVIKSVKPTMVYIPDSLQDWVKEGFEKNNIPHKFVDLRSVESLYSITKELAEKYNKKDIYNELEETKNKFFNDYNNKIKNKKKPKVLLLMGLPGSYMAATEKSYVGNLLKLSGAENIITNSNEEFVQINIEDILAKQPDYILRTAHAMPEVVMDMFKKEFENNKSWSHFNAVKENKVVDLDSHIFSMTAQFDYSTALDSLFKIFYNS